jgi:hypothetical protein
MKTALSVVRIVAQHALKDVQIVQEAVLTNAVLALRGTLFWTFCVLQRARFCMKKAILHVSLSLPTNLSITFISNPQA